MRTSLAIPAMVAAATIALGLVHGCTLPLGGVSPNGAGGAATTSATSAGGTPTTAAGITTGGGAATTTSATAASVSSGAHECTTRADCKPDGNCATYDCTAGQCVQTLINEGMVITDANGNCAKTLCMGGELKIQTDDTDSGDDGDPCTVDGCANGTPTHVAGNDGNVCGQPGQHCFGGQCLECGDATQCPPSPGPCAVAACNSGMCGFTLLDDGTNCAPGTQCKDPGTCSNGACVQNNKNNGTACTNVIAGKCAGGGCCVFATCGNGDVCCGAGQFCNGSQQCKP